jgi:hypothetical protein
MYMLADQSLQDFAGKNVRPARRKGLAAKVADSPENEAEDNADEDGAGHGEGDTPATASPGEVSGQAAEGDVEALQHNQNDADDDEEEAKVDENAAETGHERLPAPTR